MVAAFDSAFVETYFSVVADVEVRRGASVELEYDGVAYGRWVIRNALEVEDLGTIGRRPGRFTVFVPSKLPDLRGKKDGYRFWRWLERENHRCKHVQSEG